MSAKGLRIVYMGTPDFAVAPLRALVEGGYNVVAAVTMPDKPSGRGLQINQSAVKKYALSAAIPVLQPAKLKDPEFLKQLGSYDADLFIVVAFRMLPEVVWAMPPLGSFNLHASLLPQYRGAAPINWAIINGETESGVTTFFLNSKMDEGEIIGQRRVAITPQDSAGTLHDKLMEAGTGLVIETVERIAAGEAHAMPQEGCEGEANIAGGAPPSSDSCEAVPVMVLKPAPKIFKDTCRIDFSMEGGRIVDFIRGLSPYPAAWAELIPVPLASESGSNSGESEQKFAVERDLVSGKADSSLKGSGLEPVQVKVFSADFFSDSTLQRCNGSDVNTPHRKDDVYASSSTTISPSPATTAVGTIHSDGRSYIDVACGGGVVRLGDIQPAGKRRMTVREFLNGFRDINLYRFG